MSSSITVNINHQLFLSKCPWARNLFVIMQSFTVTPETNYFFRTSTAPHLSAPTEVTPQTAWAAAASSPPQPVMLPWRVGGLPDYYTHVGPIGEYRWCNLHRHHTCWIFSDTILSSSSFQPLSFLIQSTLFEPSIDGLC